MPNQYVLVDKLTPHFDAYHRDDIVVFSPPPGWASDASGTPFIKRVIGVAGDTVDIHDGFVFVNGTKLDEPYVYEGQPTVPTDPDHHTWKIAAGQLFVLGDHRADSKDSRAFGPIEEFDGDWACLAALLAVQPVRRPALVHSACGFGPRFRHQAPRRPRNHDEPARPDRLRRHDVLDAAVFAAAAVVLGGVVAVAARDGRIVVLGLMLAAVAASLVTSPLPGSLAVTARILGAMLAAYLLWAAIGSRSINGTGSAIGLVAEGAIALAAFTVGLTVAPVDPLAGPAEAQAAGLSMIALAVVPLAGRDVFRMGVGVTLLTLGGSLLVGAWTGPAFPLGQLAMAALLVGIAGATSLLIPSAEDADAAEAAADARSSPRGAAGPPRRRRPSRRPRRPEWRPRPGGRRLLRLVDQRVGGPRRFRSRSDRSSRSVGPGR